MTAARWDDIADHLARARQHFERGRQLYQAEPARGSVFDDYGRDMAFMHAFQSGYTSVETALKLTLDILGEVRPTGETWHADLLRRLARAHSDRPALPSPQLYDAVDKLRRFRDVAALAYDSFDIRDARPAYDAAAAVIAGLEAEMATFRSAVDPDAGQDERSC